MSHIPLNIIAVGFVGIYLIKIYEDIFSRGSGRSGVISLLTFYFILLNYTQSHIFAYLGFKDL